MSRRPDRSTAADNLQGVRNAYDEQGVEGYYRTAGPRYRNPHEEDVRAVLRELLADLTPGRALDLACGSGEASLVLRELGWTDIAGIDPFTAVAYRQRTGLPCTEQRFEDLAAAGLPTAHDVIVCSYALHLLDPPRLPLLCWQLAQRSGRLIVVSPNNRPELEPSWGWQIERSTRHGRARGRSYAKSPLV